MQRFRDLGNRLLDPQGSVATATGAWQNRLKSNQSRQAAFQVRLDSTEKSLLNQYSSLNAQLSAAQQSQQALSSALAGLSRG